MDKKFIRELGEIMNDIGVDELTFKNSEALITLKKYSKIGQLLEANQLLSPQSTAVRGLREGISAEGEGQDLNAQHLLLKTRSGQRGICARRRQSQKRSGDMYLGSYEDDE